MGIAQDFTNLGEELLGSYDTRVNFLGQNIVDVRNHKLDTHRFLNDCKKTHKAMGKRLRAELGGFVDHLTDTVDQLRHKFQREQKAVHQQCHQAHQSWQRVAKTMAAKRHNFKGMLTAAKQKAARAH